MPTRWMSPEPVFTSLVHTGDQSVGKDKAIGWFQGVSLLNTFLGPWGAGEPYLACLCTPRALSSLLL